MFLVNYLSPNQRVQLGLGLTLKSHGPPIRFYNFWIYINAIENRKPEMRLKSYLHNRPSNTRSRHGKTGTFTPLATAYTRRKLTRLLPSNKNVQNTRNFLTNAENPGSLTFKLLAHPIHTFSFLNKQRKIEKRCLLSQCIITDYNFRCLKSLPFSCLLHQ